MIHHVSIPARDPKRVAEALAELVGGTVRPFLGPIPDAFYVMAEDGHGTAIEVYPADVVASPGEGDAPLAIGREAVVDRFAFHVFLSVPCDRATIERIGAREGWRTRPFWRGPRNGPPVFELYELWIENRVLFEVATPDMVSRYVASATAAAQDALRASLACSLPVGQ